MLSLVPSICNRDGSGEAVGATTEFFIVTESQTHTRHPQLFRDPAGLCCLAISEGHRGSIKYWVVL